MIIDIILDRREGAINYDASKHLKAIYDYGTGLPAEKAEAIEDALLAAVNALPFPADDIFRGTGDGTREYTALFTL